MGPIRPQMATSEQWSNRGLTLHMSANGSKWSWPRFLVCKCAQRSERRPWQIQLRNVFWAVFWFSVCLAAWRWQPVWRSPHPVWDRWVTQLTFLSFRYFPIATAIGALFGRAWCGAAIGIALYLCLIAWSFFQIITGLNVKLGYPPL